MKFQLSSSVVSLPVPALESFYSDLIADLAQHYSTSLRAFWHAAWHVLEPSRDLIWNWHLDVLCEVLEDIAVKKRAGKSSNAVINLPPGVGKSVGISVVFPCWLWASDPSLKFQTFSYSRDNTVRDNRAARTIVTSEWFNTYFWSRYRQPRTGKLRPVTLSADQAGKIRFDNTERGWRIASSVEGQGTGDHGDYILMDDLVKAKDARYPNALTYANTWLDETISTRWSLDPVKILVMQRLSLFDATAHVLEKAPGQWDHVVLPMRFRKSVAPNPDGSPGRLYSCPCHATEPDKRDKRTTEGELLWPERFPDEKVKAAEVELGAFGCTPAESPILMADLSRKRISEVEVGDEVIGFEKRALSDGSEGRLKLTKSVVLETYKYDNAKVVKIYLDSGNVIRCTRDHKWFVGSRGAEGRKEYLPARERGSGGNGRPTRLRRVCAAELPDLSVEDERLAGWLSGFFDGEGSVSLGRRYRPDGTFRDSAQICFYQGAGRNKPLCDKLEYALNKFGFKFSYCEDERKPNKDAPCYGYRQYHLSGNDVDLYGRFLHIVQPTKWKDRILNGAFGSQFVKAKEQVVRIEEDGIETVYALKTTTGNYIVWGLMSSNSAGQLGQEPIPPGGALMKYSWFKYVDEVPKKARRCRGWDTADTEGGGNWTVGTLLALTDDGDLYIEDNVREQSGPGGVDKLIKATAERDGRQVLIREGSGSGKAAIAARRKMLHGYDYDSMPETAATGDKATRNKPFRGQAENGNVYIKRGSWNSAYLAVMCNFTGVGEEEDDDVDATSNGYNGLVVAPEKRRVVVGVVSRR